MKTSLTQIRKGGAVLAAAALAGSIGLVASPVIADPGEGGTGSITVYKLEQTDAPIGPNDGSTIDSSSAKPLVAGFTACSIDGVDLSKTADWARLKNITASYNGSGTLVVNEGATPMTTTCGTEQTTAASNGATTFANLAADKAYVVYESTAAANAVEVAQPTILTVPFPGTGTGATWNYNPAIYPKNVIAGSGATKDGVIVGDKATFTINVPIKPLDAGKTYTEVRVNDQLSANLKYTGATVALYNDADTAVTLDPADYTLTAPTSAVSTEVVLNFTASGLAKIDQNIGGRFTLTITADAEGNGSTANEAKITINGKTTDKGPEVVDPTDFFGGAHVINLAKNKGASTNVPQAGGVYDIYTAPAAAVDCPAAPAADQTKVFTNQTSGADGNTPNQELAKGKYCVYQTAVPAGYKGVQGGILLDVTGADANVTFVNTQVGSDAGDLPSLPITGATGTLILIISGAVLVGIGLLLFVVRKRREDEEATA